MSRVSFSAPIDPTDRLAARIKTLETLVAELQRRGGAPQLSVRRATASTYTLTASFALVTGASLSLPAGRWQVEAKGFVVQSGTGQQADMRLRDTTNAATLDTAQIYVGTGTSRVPFSMEGPAELSVAATVRLEGMIASVSGTPQVVNGRIWATPVALFL